MQLATLLVAVAAMAATAGCARAAVREVLANGVVSTDAGEIELGVGDVPFDSAATVSAAAAAAAGAALGAEDARETLFEAQRVSGKASVGGGGGGAGFYSNRTAFTEMLWPAAFAYDSGPIKCAPAGYFDVKYEWRVTVRTAGLTSYVYGYAAVREQTKHIIVAFRGSTSSMQLLSQALDSGFSRVAGIDGLVINYGARVMSALRSYWRRDVGALRRAYPSYAVAFTGHSLGGALAHLAALDCVNYNVVSASSLDVYTFGTPRHGDYEFAMAYDRAVPSSYRVVHNRDIVPHLPACKHVPGFSCFTLKGYVYHHSQEAFYPKEKYVNGQMSGYTLCHKRESRKCSDGLTFKMSVADHNSYCGISIANSCV